MAVATAALSVSLDVGDRLAKEFRSLGANLVVTPEADSLPLEIGGVDYRPVNAGAYLPESDLPKIKSVFWHNNIIAFAPILEVHPAAWLFAAKDGQYQSGDWIRDVSVIGTWSDYPVPLKDGNEFRTGIAKTNPWWQVEGRWFSDDGKECVVGAEFAAKNHLKVGDEVSLATGRVTKFPSPLKVTGIVSSGGPEDEAILVPLTQAQSLAHASGQYRKLYV
jgi:putative ABC transport system permease protein